MKIIIKCKICNSYFTVSPSRNKALYCSRKCLGKSKIGKSTWNKGKKFLPETIEKMNQAKIGKHSSPNTEFKKGHIPYMTGKHHSLKTKQVLSNRLTRYFLEDNNKLYLHNQIWTKERRRKLSQSLKGNKPWNRGLNASIDKRIIAGEKHPDWNGGSTKQKYPHIFNEFLKEMIRNRDNRKCQNCGCPEIENGKKLDVHHIDYNRNNCHSDNLISLCVHCHRKTYRDRKYWTCYFQNKIKERIWIG